MIPTILWKRTASQEVWAMMIGVIVVVLMIVTMP